ncbi:MAG: molybdenum cofactor guanylyltransferase [Anaerolineales bacterium]|nr:molybdenum cofactor guanylyltransferase [Anaerolineales bacterium]MBX3036552.1 molybdenum cofactor guanylyltransferase [Anaerolineales bacterium]
MLTIVIQAGGMSSRMGEDKALKPFLGKPLIQRVMERLNPIADEMIVTTNQPDNYSFLQTRLVPDLITGRGALGGLLTAISSASHPFVGVVACDMPFANPMFFETAHRLMVEEEADVVIPRIKSEESQKSGGYEPLHALYRKETCLPAIEDAIQKDLWKAIAWFGKVKVRDVSDDEMKSIDPSGLCFWNVNTPEEFAKAEALAKSDSHL